MSTITPNMSLVIPSVGTTEGPQYAQDINSSLTLIDQHDHSSGYGVPITPSGLNINATLTFAGNLATNLAGVNFTAQGSTPANKTVYVNTNDLYYVDGLGNNVRLTQSGAVAGTPGSIANLVSPASASYVALSATFVWQSDASIAANLDAAALKMRNISPNSTFALTLQPPAALGSNYTITLPTLPASQKIMTLDNSGNMAAPYSVDSSTIVIDSNTIKVPASGITDNELATDSVIESKIENLAVTETKIGNLAVTEGKLGNLAVATGKIAALAVTDAKMADLSVVSRTNALNWLVTNSVSGSSNSPVNAGTFVKVQNTRPLFISTSSGSVSLPSGVTDVVRVRLSDGGGGTTDLLTINGYGQTSLTFAGSAYVQSGMIFNIPAGSYTVQVVGTAGGPSTWTNLVFIIYEL